MEIKSSVFKNGENIPEKYTCEGWGINPPLEFSGISEDAKSLALVVDDPDAPMGTWIHWTLWNIDPKIDIIEENSVPQGAVQGKTSAGKSCYNSPCPPSGKHRYFFKLYAMDKKIELVRTANKTARTFDKRIKQVIVMYRDSVQKVQIATSEGFIAEDERIHTLMVVHVIASDNGVIQTGYEPAGGLIGFELFENVKPEELALTAARRATMMLTAQRAPGGRMPVVISSNAGGTMIHEAIGHGLEADLAQQGLSVYSEKIGKQVASPLVTVLDDATIPNKRGSFRFDDEGTPSQRTVLVKNGKLTGYMYDNYTAMQDKTRSTGNGRRESYHSRPIPRMTNTFIASGESLPEDVLQSTPKGLFVKKMGGGQVNTVTGDFVFEVQEGYIIDNGRIGEPVRGATLTGNGPEVLKSIDRVGSDMGFSIGTCGKDNQGVPVSDAMPTIRIPEIVVGGET